MGNKRIFANQKMYMTKKEVDEFIKILGSIHSEQLVICPTAIYVEKFSQSKLILGMQNIFYEDSGAYTGEISPLQAKDYHIQYAIVGHSERRNILNESNDMLKKKIQACIAHNITPIFCIGETKEQYEMHKTNEILKRQIIDVFQGLKIHDISKIMIAYEPIWAIGTGFIPTEKEIKDTTQYIKNIVWQLFYVSISVLYGGSVNEKNVQSLNQIDVVDGFLVGGASTKPKELLKMYEVVVS